MNNCHSISFRDLYWNLFWIDSSLYTIWKRRKETSPFTILIPSGRLSTSHHAPFAITITCWLGHGWFPHFQPLHSFIMRDLCKHLVQPGGIQQYIQDPRTLQTGTIASWHSEWHGILEHYFSYFSSLFLFLIVVQIALELYWRGPQMGWVALLVFKP